MFLCVSLWAFDFLLNDSKAVILFVWIVQFLASGNISCGFVGSFDICPHLRI